MLQSIDIDRSLESERLLEVSGFRRLSDKLTLGAGLIAGVALLVMELSKLQIFNAPKKIIWR